MILGAGFGGLRTALDLTKYQKKREIPEEWEIVLIDKNSYHLYTPLLYEVAAGYIGDDAPSEREFRTGAALPIEFIISGRKIKFIQSEVRTIDCANKYLGLNGGEKICYDYLVLALGAKTEYFDVSKAEECSYSFKTMHDALVIRRKIVDLLALLRRGNKDRLRIVICGGGATGSEFAAELANFFKRLEKQKIISRRHWSITLIEASPRVVSAFGPKVSGMARLRLENLGVKVMVDVCVKSASFGKITLAPRPLKKGEKEEDLLCEFLSEKEKEIKADMLIWTAGIRAVNILERCGLPVDVKGRLLVDEYLRVKEADNIFAIGDNAFLLDPKTRQPAPALAQAAILQGKIAAANISRLIQDKPLLLYEFPEFPSIVPLGGKRAAAKIGNLVLGGFFAWLLHKLADLRYFLKILPQLKAFKVFLKGLRIYLKND